MSNTTTHSPPNLGGENYGFTLIELIVVIGIILMMTGTAISTFTRARDKDLVTGEARLVGDLIQGTLRKAKATQKPAECIGSTIDTYQIRFTSDTKIDVYAMCSGTEKQTDSLTLLHSLVTEPAVGTTLDISTLFGGVTETTIKLCGSTYQYKIDVGSAGSISEPTEDGSC